MRARWVATHTCGLSRAIASAALLPLLFLWAQRWPSATLYWAPLLIVILVMFTVAIAIGVSAITVYVRDLQSGLPLLMQLGLFLTPMLLGLPKEAQDSLGKQVPFPSRLGNPVEYGMLVRSIVEKPKRTGLPVVGCVQVRDASSSIAAFNAPFSTLRGSEYS